jgi:hypothetical protein
LRCWRRERLGDPPFDRTLRYPPCPERDRVTQRDDHRTDATTPDHRGHTVVDPNPDLGRASQLADEQAGDVG